LRRLIGYLEKKWKKFAPNYPFEFSFLNDTYIRLYKSEEKTGSVFLYFTFVAVFVSCLGLLGLASYRVAQSRKEMGVRKVFGASVRVIILLLSKEFTKWVLIANIFAWPTAYLVMVKWLQNFAYKESISLSSFLMAALLAWGIALLTIGYQSVKAALANPVDILKYE
jgi:putative ABC transport system permease protein